MHDGSPSPADRPEPQDNSPHLRARVPDHVADGAFSTGAIVVSGPTEFIIDFLQTIGRPHKVAARVIIPHAVMPQFIEALAKNWSLYRDRFGVPRQLAGTGSPATAIGATGIPQPGGPIIPTAPPASQTAAEAAAAAESGDLNSPSKLGSAFGSTDVFPGATPPAAPSTPPGQSPPTKTGSGEAATGKTSESMGGTGHQPPAVRRPTPQEIYDDLKIPEHVLSGAYANGVMIGHGASEFGLDFLTSFYPQSAVSARVFLAAGQIPRLLESLQQAMRQLPPQQQPPRRSDDHPRTDNDPPSY